jgi:hypothetical protein
MDLDVRQTRRLFLAGTAAFPTPFPTAGAVAFETGYLKYSRGARPKETAFVSVVELSHRTRSKTRVILQEDVSALFIPGRWRGGQFRISRRAQVHDLERGEWFLDGDVNADCVRERLKLKECPVDPENSVLRGIVFVAGHRPVITTSQRVELARVAAKRMKRRREPRCDRHYCDEGFWPGCENGAY